MQSWLRRATSRINRSNRTAAVQFIADVHLGKLARMLRMLGIDTLYRRNYTEEELVNTARHEQRVLMTRKATHATHSDLKCFIIQDKNPEVQILEVLDHFRIRHSIKPFTRCMVCNGLLQEVAKESVMHLLPPETAKYTNEFWQCTDCERVCWKGAHHRRMLTKLARLGIQL